MAEKKTPEEETPEQVEAEVEAAEARRPSPTRPPPRPLRTTPPTTPVAEADEEPAERLGRRSPATTPRRLRRPRRSRAAARAASRLSAAEEKPEPAPRRTWEPGERPEVRAHAKYVRSSARKARLVCDHIRGKSVVEARAILAHTPRSVAEDWEKLLNSAVANAEHNHELIGDELRILSITADEGPTLKRFRPRAKGRADRIRKRTSHLSITLTPKE